MCLLLLKEKYCSKWIVKEPESFRGIWTELLGIVNPHFVFDVCLNPVDWPLPPAWPPFPPALWSLCLSPESPCVSSEARRHTDGKPELASEPNKTYFYKSLSLCAYTCTCSIICRSFRCWLLSMSSKWWIFSFRIAFSFSTSSNLLHN